MSCDETASLKRLFMTKVIKIVVVTMTMLMAVPAIATAKGNANVDSFDWTPVINAIIHVESRGNAKAVSGKSCGIMQITPICVKECNRILQVRKSQKRYTMDDRFDAEKSKEMFLLMQSFYNKANDVEHAIRSWNGGQKYSRRATQGYYEKVMRQMK